MSSESSTTQRTLHKKPSESAFKQQKLPAWQPILTAGTVLPTFFVIGIAFIPIGIGVLYFSEKVDETSADYTYCVSIENNTERCADLLEQGNTNCTCRKEITLDKDFKGQVYMYYALTNFYQNHRRYVKSRDDLQLLGKLSDEVSGDCAPFDKNSSGATIAPCGAIANSMFSDSITLWEKDSNLQVPLIRTGIAWPSDKEIKFRNPPGNLSEVFKPYAKPINWTKNIWELDEENPENNGFQNEDFIVWMRTAALPNFRKLYRLIDHTKPPYQNGVPKGTYYLHIHYTFKVVGFQGTKRIILSTTSILGAKNPFLGYAYITVGCLCLLVGIVFLIIHIKYGKSTAEVINVTPTTSYQ